jgi:threonine/homoserine/homoserine lactone efflux protein
VVLAGLVVDVTNPKVLLFLIAFLPQFLGHAENRVLQLQMLGCTFQVTGRAIDLAVGLLAGSVRERVPGRPWAGRALGWCAAAVYGVLAVVVGVEFVAGVLKPPQVGR